MKVNLVAQVVLAGASVLLLSQLGDSSPALAYKQTQSVSVAQAPVAQVDKDSSVLDASGSVEEVVKVAILAAFGVTVIKFLK